LRERVYNALQKPNAPLTPAKIQQKLAALRATVRPAFNMELARFNRTFYNSFEQEYADNVGHLPTRYQYNLNKWLGVLNGTLRPVASEGVDNQSFVVSPNPAHDYLDVDLKAANHQFTELTVYNLLGAPVLKQQVEQANSTYRFPLQALQTGQYILVIQIAGQKTTTRKFVVSH
jgi:Secretion system C-terminal sorting domain